MAGQPSWQLCTVGRYVEVCKKQFLAVAAAAIGLVHMFAANMLQHACSASKML
jgi:hypothetical protein